MINLALFKHELKSALVFILIFMAILTLYIGVIVWMYDPELGKALAMFQESMPELMDLFGMGSSASDLISHIANYLFGFLLIIFPIILTIMLANHLFVSKVDTGAMAYLLQAPVSRTTIFITQLKVLMTSITLLILYCFMITVVFSNIFYPNELDILELVYLYLGLFALHYFVAAISVLLSVSFNEVKYYLTYSIGFIVISYMLQMIVNISDKLIFLKYFTFFSLLNTTYLINKDVKAIYFMVILIVSGICINLISLINFNKKDMPV